MAISSLYSIGTTLNSPFSALKYIDVYIFVVMHTVKYIFQLVSNSNP